MKKDCFIGLDKPGRGLLKDMGIHLDKCGTDNFSLLNTIRKRAGFTLIELIIATSILSIIA